LKLNIHSFGSIPVKVLADGPSFRSGSYGSDNKIENFLEERTGRDRRKDETPEQAKANAERRTGEERRDGEGASPR
jgi:hypothetical protein